MLRAARVRVHRKPGGRLVEPVEGGEGSGCREARGSGPRATAAVEASEGADGYQIIEGAEHNQAGADDVPAFR